ncbi:hypothetical protein AHF37_00066 [Paragonimus kellicotti]|nr:hypothetical protein AHF37_00066 [Paragonimus kellicotti]
MIDPFSAARKNTVMPLHSSVIKELRVAIASRRFAMQEREQRALEKRLRSNPASLAQEVDPVSYIVQLGLLLRKWTHSLHSLRGHLLELDQLRAAVEQGLASGDTHSDSRTESNLPPTKYPGEFGAVRKVTRSLHMHLLVAIST